MPAELAIAALACGLLAAAVFDLARYEIPNWLNAAIALAFPPLALLAGAPLETVFMHLLVGAGLLCVGFALFQTGAVGGGDAKLIAAVGVWTGLAALGPFLIWTAIAGGAFALLLIALRRGVFRAGAPAGLRVLERGAAIPYGVAVAAGGLAAAPALPL